MTSSPGLLILCGGSEAVAGIKRARELGFRTVVVDGDASAPGRAVADKFIQASIYHPKAVIDALYPLWDQLDISGVTTVAADNSLTVALVGEQFHRRTQSVRTATLATDKLEMKEAMRKAGIPLPWYCAISSLDHLKKQVFERPGSYVLKPIDSRGARGVTRISEASECQAAFEHARAHTQADQLILEEWLTGDQLSSESIVYCGTAHLCGFADRNYERLEDLYPHVVEDGGETPSKYFCEEMVENIDDLMSRICRAIDLTEGSIKGDLVISDGKVFVIEIASRLSGGSFSTITIPLVHRYDLVGNVFRMSVGMEPELPARPLVIHSYQANRFIFLPPGVVRSIGPTPSNRKNLISHNLSVKVGDVLERTADHTMRGGWVLTTGVNRAEAVAEAESFMRDMHIIVESSKESPIGLK